MKNINTQYNPLPQSKMDAKILKSITLLSAIFCLIMLGITVSMAYSADHSMAAVLFSLYVSCLFMSFGYAALSVRHAASKTALTPLTLASSHSNTSDHRAM